MQKTIKIAAVILLFLCSLSALFGGWRLMSDPDGSSLELSDSWLERSPFESYLVPGIILFLFVGILSLYTGISAIRKTKGYRNLIIVQGAIIILYVIAEIVLLKVLSPLQLIYLVIGVLISLSGLYLKKIELI